MLGGRRKPVLRHASSAGAFLRAMFQLEILASVAKNEPIYFFLFIGAFFFKKLHFMQPFFPKHASLYMKPLFFWRD